MWITFNEFLRFLLFNLRKNCLSMISNDLQGRTEIVFSTECTIGMVEGDLK